MLFIMIKWSHSKVVVESCKKALSSPFVLTRIEDAGKRGNRCLRCAHTWKKSSEGSLNQAFFPPDFGQALRSPAFSAGYTKGHS